MKARVFFDAFAECLCNVAMGRKYPYLVESLRAISVSHVTVRHGDAHAEATGLMFDRLWSEAENPPAR